MVTKEKHSSDKAYNVTTWMSYVNVHTQKERKFILGLGSLHYNTTSKRFTKNVVSLFLINVYTKKQQILKWNDSGSKKETKLFNFQLDFQREPRRRVLDNAKRHTGLKSQTKFTNRKAIKI